MSSQSVTSAKRPRADGDASGERTLPRLDRIGVDRRASRVAMRAFLILVCAVLQSALAPASATAEVAELRWAHPLGVLFLPMAVLEREKLVEKRAAEAGLGDVKVSWVTFGFGGAVTDALLSGNVDLATAGTSNMLLLWSRTRGDVKAVAGAGTAPSLLLTSNPHVERIEDFTDKDRIALPTVKVSTQAIFLQMAAAKAFGASQWGRLDALTVGLPHTEAMIALLNPNLEIDAHFSAPPFQGEELKRAGIHRVLSSQDITDGPMTDTVVMATSRFHDQNPKLVGAVIAALGDAARLIETDKARAARDYLDVTREKSSAEEIADVISQPGTSFSLAPVQTAKFADFMYRTGLLKMQAHSWKDFFFAELHSVPGS